MSDDKIIDKIEKVIPVVPSLSPEAAEESIREHFPFRNNENVPQYRAHQFESIMTALTTDKKFVVINAPVGYGKTVAAYVFSKAFGTGSYITHQKSLQEQILGERWPGVASLKGKNSYSCVYANIKQKTEAMMTGVGEIMCGFEDTATSVTMCNTDGESAKNGHASTTQLKDIGQLSTNMTDALFSYLKINRSFKESTSMDVSDIKKDTDKSEVIDRFRRFYTEMYMGLKDYYERNAIGGIEKSEMDIIGGFMCSCGIYECPKKSAYCTMLLASVRVFNPDLFAIYRNFGIYGQITCNNVMVFDEAHAIEDVAQRVYGASIPIKAFRDGVGIDIEFLGDNSIKSVIKFADLYTNYIEPVHVITKMALKERALLEDGGSATSFMNMNITDISDKSLYVILASLKKSIARDPKASFNIFDNIIFPAISDKEVTHFESKYHDIIAWYRELFRENLPGDKCISEENAKAVISNFKRLAVRHGDKFHTNSESYKEFKTSGDTWDLLVDHMQGVKHTFNRYFDKLAILYIGASKVKEDDSVIPFIFDGTSMESKDAHKSKSEIIKHYTGKDELISCMKIIPVNIGWLMSNTFYKSSNKILMMSGTWINKDKMFDIFGIPDDDVEYIEIQPIFDRVRRPIIVTQKKSYYDFSEKLPREEQGAGIYYRYQTSAGRKEWLEHLSFEIQNLREFIRVQNGIENANIVLHTGTVSIRNAIVESIDCADHSWYAQSPSPIYKSMFNVVSGHTFEFVKKDDLIEMFRDNPDSGLTLVCYSMNEGIDFKYGAARGQIIVKCPTPNFGDPYIQARVKGSATAGIKADNGYFDRKIMITLTQQYGRVVRSDDDWGYTITFDQQITRRLRGTCHPMNINMNKRDGLNYLISGIRVADPKRVTFSQMKKVI